MEGAPPPPQFNAPANAVSPFGGDEFETVVISSDGMDTEPQQLPQMMGQPSMSVQQQSASGALFPEPGTTTTAEVGGFSSTGMTRVATIHFASSSSALDERDRSILGAVIQLQRERGGHVVVVGHASSRTRDMDYITHQMVNFQISMERATTIGNELKDLGLEDEVLEVQAVSDTTPLYMEVMPSGEAGNRRVEIYLAL
jgi:outer membrane protein OmpA-like peptidoglycan-associated protein